MLCAKTSPDNKDDIDDDDGDNDNNNDGDCDGDVVVGDDSDTRLHIRQ